MKKEFETSQAPTQPLGRDGEITEWLTVKERADGKMRSMTMREAIKHHDRVWGFDQYTSLPDSHTAAHILLGLAYGKNATNNNYQGTIPAEVFAVAIQHALNNVTKRGYVLFGDVSEEFHKEAQQSFETLYSWAMYSRTLTYEILQRRRERGIEGTVDGIREETGHKNIMLEALAGNEGVVVQVSECNNVKSGITFTVQGREKEYSLKHREGKFETVLPPEGPYFQNMQCAPDLLVRRIFDRVWPTICHMRYQQDCAVGWPFDMYAKIDMGHLARAMDDVPVPTPMLVMPVYPKVETAQPVPVMM